MKRIISISLAVLIIVSTFSGCGLKLSDYIKIDFNSKTSASESTAIDETTLPAATKSEKTTKQKETTTKPHTAATPTTRPVQTTTKPGIHKDGVYTSKADVALYIHTFSKLPKNFITKSQAKALGWPGGGLDPYAPGKCIGGDYFSNYEGLLPKAAGRSYTECDIDTLHAEVRGAKRIVFSNDGLIYYTGNHYVSFTRLY